MNMRVQPKTEANSEFLPAPGDAFYTTSNKRQPKTYDSDRFVLVVGDKFAKFAVGNDAITLSQLKGLLGLPAEMLVSPARLVLLPGQGLGDGDLADVLSLAEASPVGGRIVLDLWRRAPRRAAGNRSHKQHCANTLISEPRRLDEDHYELDLLVDDRSELMADHQTGQHLQGMILVEAARQSFLAVTEAFFLPQDGTAFTFVFNDVSAEYRKFAFPLPARLLYCIREKELGNSQRRFAVEVAVEQAGSHVAVISGSFIAARGKAIAKMEAALAREVVASHMAVAAGSGAAPGLMHAAE